VLVVDAEGNITEDWTKWDSLFRRPHSVTINPYDPEKHIWIVEDRNHVIYKFSHDGKQLVQTLGEKGVSGNDSAHFNRPTFLAWLPDSTMFVSDGYANTRVVKFDKDGKFRCVGREGLRQRHAAGDLRRCAWRPGGSRRARSTSPIAPARIQVFDEAEITSTSSAGYRRRRRSSSAPPTVCGSPQRLENRQVRHRGTLSLLLGQQGRVAGGALERPWPERRSGRQPVPG
jgi:hypothetical protein